MVRRYTLRVSRDKGRDRRRGTTVGREGGGEEEMISTMYEIGSSDKSLIIVTPFFQPPAARHRAGLSCQQLSPKMKELELTVDMYPSSNTSSSTIAVI
eukprot:767546-Hanusia_phi.AAC.3